jgi:trimethylamine--corrinoid protein Co-methyltransferase
MKLALEKIHDTSMTILEKAGIRLHHAGIVAMLKEAGVRVADDRVYFNRNFLMELVRQAPSRFTLHARNPVHNVVIGRDKTHKGAPRYVPGYGCPAIMDADGTRRTARHDDFLRFVQLVQQSPAFRINGGILVQPSDLPGEWAHMLMTYTTLVHSDKCIMGQTGSAREVTRIMDMAAIVFGGRKNLEKKPGVITLVNTLSPLQMDFHALETIKIHAEFGQPVVIGSGLMSGTTAPVTLAGAIALGNAETLAGVALTQLIRPGTPAVMAINMTPVDMRTGGVNLGSPAHALAVKYCAGLSRMYNLPCRCGGNNTSAIGLTAQSGYESMMNMMVSIKEGVDLIIHSAGILDGWSAMSYEKFVMDLEIIRMVEYVVQGLSLTDNDLALDAICEVGPGGQFLTHPHTLKNCRQNAWVPTIDLFGVDRQKGAAFRDTTEKIQARVKALLSSHHPPELNEKILSRLDEYLLTNGVSEDAVTRCFSVENHS